MRSALVYNISAYERNLYLEAASDDKCTISLAIRRHAARPRSFMYGLECSPVEKKYIVLQFCCLKAFSIRHSTVSNLFSTRPVC